MTRVRVGLDVTPAITGSTGVARYASELRRALERHDVEIRAFAIGRAAHPVEPHTRHLRVPLRVVQRSWSALGLPRAEQIVGPLDVVHSLDLVAPPTRRPLVITIMDLVALERPDLHDARARRQQEARVRDAARADVVIVPTEATRRTLIAHGAEPDAIVVVPLGVSELGPPDAGTEGEGAILAVGGLNPRKGLDVLLRGAATMRNPIPIVLAGPPESDRDRLRHLVAELDLSARVTMLDRVSDAELAGLYRRALVLCFPSRAEGFGFPVVEAMAAGLPVVASDLPVVAEVSDGAAVLVPSDHPEAFADALDRVAEDAGLRDRLRASGRRRAAHFTWVATASGTAQAYRLALDRGAAR